MIENCGLLEFPSLGNILSWSGRSKKQVVKCRLDRALGNNEWHNLFSCSHVEYLGMIGSDHRPIVVSIDNKVLKFRRQFWFDKQWIGKDGLMESITRGWNSRSGRGEVGVVEKIHNCRQEISVWRKANPPYGKEKNEYITKGT